MYGKLIAVYDDSMFMFADKNLDEVNEKDKCVVYNKDLRKFTPEMCIGSWTCRMSPWVKPTKAHIERAKYFKRTENEN